MGLQFAHITQEAVFGTFNASATSGQKALVFLPESDAMGVIADPKYQEIRDAGIGNRAIRRLLGRTSVGGPISMLLFPSQAQLIMNLSVATAGSPCWTLPSFTIDRVLFLDDTCTPIYERYLGCKVGNLSLVAAAGDSGFLLAAKLDVIGSRVDHTITVTDFPTPAFGSYPVDNPWNFYELAGNVTIDTSRTNFKSFNFTIANMVKPFMDETLFASSINYFGRDISWGTVLKYKAATDRLAWEAGSLHAVSFEFNDGTHSLTLDLKASNSYTGVTNALPIDDYFTQALAGKALVDQSALNDFAATVA